MAEKDFRVKKGLQVDGTGTSSIAGSLGIGTTSPTDSLAVRGGIKIGEFNDTDGAGYSGSAAPSSANTGTGAADPQLRVSGRASDQPGIIQMAYFDANNFFGATTDSTANYTLGKIQFAMNENSQEVTNVAEIRSTSRQVDVSDSGDGKFKGDLQFLTSDGSTSAASLTTKMTITEGGNVGIGTTTPVSRLDLNTGALSFANTNTQLKLSGGSNVDLQLGHWGNTHILIDTDGNDTSRYFSVRHGNATAGSATELFKVHENGTTTVTGSLDVSGGISATVQPKATTATAGNNTANQYAKLLTFNPTGTNHRDCNLILGVTAHTSGATGSAIISVKFRSNGATAQYTADVAFMSKTGTSVFNQDAFQIFSDGNLTAQDNNTDMELWVQKNTSYNSVQVHELSKAITPFCTLTYHTDSAWQSSAPTNNTFTTTTQGIELNLDKVRMGISGVASFLHLHPQAANSYLTTSTDGLDVTLAADNDLTLHADDDIFFQAGGATKMTLLNTGELGIGTSTPAFPLHLKYTDNDTTPEGGSTSGSGTIGSGAEGGGLYIENASTTDGSYASITFRTDTADARIAYQSVGSSLINEGQMSFYLDTNDADSNTPSSVFTLEEVLRLRGGSSDSDSAQAFNSAYVNGRLGVGAASPSMPLHVESADNDLALFKSTDANAGIRIDTPDDGYAVVFFSEAGTNKWSLGKLASNSDKFSIYDEVNTTPRLVIESSGDVGIGTTSPDFTLDVTGTFQAQGDHSGNVVIDNTGTTQTILASHTGAGTPVPWDIRESSSANNNDAAYGVLHLTRMNVNTDGAGANLHFRTKKNDGSAQEVGGIGATIDTGLTANATATGSLHFYTTDAGSNRQEKMTIKSGGNVGIGNTSPGHKLHVSGPPDDSGDYAIYADEGTDQYVALVNRHSANRRTALFYRNVHADYTAQPMVEMHNDHANDDQTVLKIKQDGTGFGLQVDGNVLLGSVFDKPTGSTFDAADAQLILGGAFNAEFNTGTDKAHLLISSHDNDDGTALYPIFVQDENVGNNSGADAITGADFFIKNRQSSSGDSTAYFGGKVGIGTISPSYDLHVVGSGYFTDDLRVGNTTPSKITLNGNDAFVEGQLEVTGTAGSYIYSLALGTSSPTSTAGNIETSGGIGAASASFSGQMTAGSTSVGSYQVVNTTTAITQNGQAINGTNTTNIRAEAGTYAFSNAYILAGSLANGSEHELFRFNVTNTNYRKFQAGKMYIRVQDTATSGFFQQTVTFGDTGGDVFSSATDRLDSAMGGVQAAWNDEKATIVVSKVSDYICVKFKNETGSAIAAGGWRAQLSCELFEMDAMPS